VILGSRPGAVLEIEQSAGVTAITLEMENQQKTYKIPMLIITPKAIDKE
jgi:hypothetical protein